MKVTAGHWIALGMFLTSVATQLSGLHGTWHEVLTPTFISGLVMNAGSVIIAAASGKLFPIGVSNAK